MVDDSGFAINSMSIKMKATFRILILATSLLLLPTIMPFVTDHTNHVVHVDLSLNDNTARHHTTKYQQIYHANHAHNAIGPSIVLRRGEQFNIIIHLNRTYNKDFDKIRLEFSIGLKPQLDKGTLIYLPVDNSNNDTSKWNSRMSLIYGNQLSVQINLPPNMPIGMWRLRISTKILNTKKIYTYTINEALCIIFNPWNRDDSVYMSREDARQEYVLNEVGKIYIGLPAKPSGRKWTYGQFHESVLPILMSMLDKTRLDINDRADVVKVSRAISAIVNSLDDNGLLVGNWSGSYSEGLAPWQWTGSPTIFEKYQQSGGRPVKFGQCWVFGGVTTTALRALGIPARTVTNFLSAHDTDSSLTIDKFFDEKGNIIDGVNSDSIWNFHVWSDAWMAREDLPPGYGGWQAIDATPQQTSMGLFQLGPASLEAIKQGKVDFAYDVWFVYSEVNADVVHWTLDKRSKFQWRKNLIQTAHVGRKILTKMIGILDDRSRFGVNDAEDIVSQYKHIEGSREERFAFSEAARSGGLIPLFEKW